MIRRIPLALLALASIGFLAATTTAAEVEGLKKGTPELKSAGALAFAPEGVLLVADPLGAAVYAIDTGDRQKNGGEAIKITGIDEKVAGLLGIDAKQIAINDLAVNPISGNAYLSVSRGKGPDAIPAIVRVGQQGVSELSLKDVKFAKAELANAPSINAKDRRGGSLRLSSITDLNYADGRVFVAGLSNEEFASKLRSLAYPFSETDSGTSIEIYHGAHGAVETHAPVKTFIPYVINGQAHLLAAYTCTPLVKIPIAELKSGKKVTGTTVAELGNRNQPLDMIIYQKDGKDYILMANSARGVMKISTDKIDSIEGIKEKISDKAGLPYETVKELKGITQLAKLNDGHALVIVQGPSGSNLETIALP